MSNRTLEIAMLIILVLGLVIGFVLHPGEKSEYVIVRVTNTNKEE